MHFAAMQVVENYALCEGLLDSIKIGTHGRSLTIRLSAVPIADSHPAAQKTLLIRKRNLLGDVDYRNLTLFFSGCKDPVVELNGKALQDLDFDFPLSNGMDKFDLTRSNAISWTADLISEELRLGFEFSGLRVEEN